MRRRRARLLPRGLTLLVMIASPAAASDVATEFGLGNLDRFPDEQTAQAHCQGDGVVWSDPKTGFFYPRFVPEFGVGSTGAFTCYKQAKGAGYWGFGTADSLASRAGRVFPSTCVWVVDKTGHAFCGAAGM